MDQHDWPQSLEDHAQRLGPWFARHAADLGAEDAVVRRVTRMSDGHSSVTLGVELGPGVGGDGDQVALVLRTNPSGPGLLDEYDLEKQFEMMRALDDSEVPVPTMLWFEEDPAVIGRPFFVMERVDAEIIEYAVPEWLRAAPPETCRSMCEQFVDAIAALHAISPADDRFSFLGPPRSDFLAGELDRWAGMATSALSVPSPSVDQLIGWLRDNQPEGSERLSLLHGDLKWGNFAFRDGELVGLFDWEMADIGDPLVDLGYALSYWTSGPAALPGALTRDEFLARYQSRTGIEIDDLAWFEVLNGLKTVAILLRGTALFEGGEVHDLRYSWFSAALPMTIEGSLARAGIDGPYDHGLIGPSPRRIAEAVERLLTTVVLPAVGDDDARADAALIGPALQSLVAAAEGRTFDIGEAFDAAD